MNNKCQVQQNNADPRQSVFILSAHNELRILKVILERKKKSYIKHCKSLSTFLSEHYNKRKKKRNARVNAGKFKNCVRNIAYYLKQNTIIFLHIFINE